jgi:hypothetical protein
MRERVSQPILLRLPDRPAPARIPPAQPDRFEVGLEGD